jgi:hypothetical protein
MILSLLHHVFIFLVYCLYLSTNQHYKSCLSFGLPFVYSYHMIHNICLVVSFELNVCVFPNMIIWIKSNRENLQMYHKRVCVHFLFMLEMLLTDYL